MKQSKINEAVGLIDDGLIQEYNAYQKKKRLNPWSYAAIAAACLILVTTGGLITLIWSGLLSFGAASGGIGSNADSPNYMYYAGPVFPLTLLENNEALTARREINFDFSPYAEREKTYEITENGRIVEETYTSFDRQSIITDSYFLENKGVNTEKVTFVYPFASSLNELASDRPIIKVDGREISTDIHFGPYSGNFTGTWPISDNEVRRESSYNLDYISNWQEYMTLLTDGRYMRQAFAETPQLAQQVIIYEVSDPVIVTGEGTNPSIGIHYNAGSKTTVLSYGFHGFSSDGSNNFIQGFSLPNEYRSQPSSKFWLIVLGEDLQNLQLQGYKTMNLAQGNEMEISARITRRVADLDATLRALLDDFFVQLSDIRPIPGEISFEQHYQAAVELLLSYGLLSDDPKERYMLGWLADAFSEAGSHDRVMYLTEEIEIPAGSTAEISAEMTKKGSYDFYCRHKRDRNIEGYELLTKMGSNLNFQEQTASIKDNGLIEIVRQNFGFDLEQGIRSVPLDLSEDHYFLEIRKIN